MGNLHQLRSELLRDNKITDDEVALIREYIEQDGKLDIDDIRLLVDLLVDAREVSAGFDDLFFPALKEVILRDGMIGYDENYYLLKMLYGDGVVRDCERAFLLELRQEADRVSAEFESLCAQAMTVADRDWSVGGTPT